MSLKINNSIKSPNFSDRPTGVTVNTVVLHYTQGDFEISKKWLCDPLKGVSSHYIINEDGEIYNLVSPDKKAFHAGKSSWKGIEAVNDYSIGIEIINDGDTEFSEKQINSVIKLCSHLKDIYPEIHNNNIIGHSDVALGRKLDPGKYFPWEKLAEANIGVWHGFNLKKEKRDIIFKLGDIDKKIIEIKQKLKDYGYDIKNINDSFDQELKISIYAMQLHFDREHITGEIDTVALKIINYLSGICSV